MTASDHIRALFNHSSAPDSSTYVCVNDAPIRTFGLMRGYTREEGGAPILVRPGCHARRWGWRSSLAPCPRWKTGWCAIIRAIWRGSWCGSTPREISVWWRIPSAGRRETEWRNEGRYAVICGKGEKRAVPDAGAAACAAHGPRPTACCSTATPSAPRRCGSSPRAADFAARLPRLFQRAFGLNFDRLAGGGARGS